MITFNINENFSKGRLINFIFVMDLLIKNVLGDFMIYIERAEGGGNIISLKSLK